MWDILLLVSALCIDEMVASMAYGTDGIKIRLRDAALMNVISSSFLGFALFMGSLLQGLMTREVAQVIGFVCLFLLGTLKLLDYSIKAYINRHSHLWKNISFSFSSLKFIISIYGNPIEADQDESHTLSCRETVFLACAMSIDSLVAGTLAAFLDINLWISVGMAFLIGCVSVMSGFFLGKKIAVRCKWDLSWIGGVLLILLAVSKL